ncbi:hypothetical protein BH09CHL1_BH09CHL1_34570 [soil metagenome]
MILLDPGQTSPVSELLIEVLVCPRDHADLRVDSGNLVCTECGSRFVVQDGVPNMLIDEE